MEFHKKLQLLRNEKGVTQEELAKLLFVSRTAVSKWESGRGYPNIDSLKAISKLFAVSIDDLLSGEELIDLAESEQKQNTANTRNLIFGILDCTVSLLFFLPLFGQPQNGKVVTVPLLATYGDSDYIFFTYIFFVGIITVFGVAQLALQNLKNKVWVKQKVPLSLSFSVAVLLFSIANRQPYVGAFLLCLLVTKGILLIKQQ